MEGEMIEVGGEKRKNSETSLGNMFKRVFSKQATINMFKKGWRE